VSVTCERCTFEIADGLAQVVLRLRNRGEAPVYVVSQMRRLTIEDEGSTVVLWLTERGAPARTLRQLSLPEVLEIPAGQEREIEITLPERMTHRRDAPVGERGGLETLDLGKTERAVIRLGVADTPFLAHPERDDLLHQLQEWGEDVEVRAERGAGAGRT